jgi:hypothetical protein
MPLAAVDSIASLILADGQDAHVVALDVDEMASFRNISISDALAGGLR